MNKIILLFFLTSIGYSQVPNVDAPTPPSRPEADVVSIFSDTYNNIPINAWASEFSDVIIDGNATKIVDLPDGEVNAIIDFIPEKFDATEFTHMHIDYYTDNGDILNVKLRNHDGVDGTTGPSNTPSGFIPNIGNGAWRSLDLSLDDDFSPGPPGFSFLRNAIGQIVISANSYDSQPVQIYIDNIYFYKPLYDETTSTLNNLEIDDKRITNFNSETYTYTYPVDRNDTAIPQITSVITTNPNATQITTQATDVPGNATVVITAEDGTTMQTYTVSFIEVGPETAAPTPPLRPEADVVSIFSDTYNNIPIAAWDSRFSDITIEGNTTKIGESVSNVLSNAFIEFIPEKFDATEFIKLHIDYYTDTVGIINVQLLNYDGVDGTSGPSSSIADLVLGIGQGEWRSLDLSLDDDFSLGSGSSSLSRNAIGQILFSGNVTGGSQELAKIYIDNIYFHKGTTLNNEEFTLPNFNIYPNPTENIWNIKTDNQNINSIQLFDIHGRRVISIEPNGDSVKINASTLTAGLYFARINTTTGFKSIKLIKK